MHDRHVLGVSVRLWRKALQLPWPEMAARLTEQSPAGLRLRGTNPLFGVLTASECRRIAAAFALDFMPALAPAGGRGLTP